MQLSGLRWCAGTEDADGALAGGSGGDDDGHGSFVLHGRESKGRRIERGRQLGEGKTLSAILIEGNAAARRARIIAVLRLLARAVQVAGNVRHRVNSPQMLGQNQQKRD